MLDASAAQDRCAELLARARRLGADCGDAVYAGDTSESVTVRLGALEDVERSENESISLRVFVGRRSASVGTTDLSGDALEALADRVVAMARAAPEDQYAGLAPEELLSHGPYPELDLLDPADRGPAALRETAMAAEDAARAVAGVTNSEGGSASAGRGCFALVTSHGFAGGYCTSSHGVSASVVAGEGAGMQRDYAYRSARHAGDLLGPQDIGALAGVRAVARLNPARVRSGPMPLVFDARVSSGLIGHLLGAINGAAIARRASFLLGKEGGQLFDSAVNIQEEPHRRRGLRSRPFDGEGLATTPRALVQAGRLTGWLMDSAAARQLGQAPTGHASRGGNGAPGISPSNVCLAAGPATPAELIADIGDGLWVTELIGHGVNPVTGDYSRGASGFRIRDGQLAEPVAEFTVAGNLLDMFAAMIPANDLELWRGMDAPSVRIDGMTIAGD